MVRKFHGTEAFLGLDRGELKKTVNRMTDGVPSEENRSSDLVGEGIFDILTPNAMANVAKEKYVAPIHRRYVGYRPPRHGTEPPYYNTETMTWLHPDLRPPNIGAVDEYRGFLIHCGWVDDMVAIDYYNNFVPPDIRSKDPEFYALDISEHYIACLEREWPLARLFFNHNNGAYGKYWDTHTVNDARYNEWFAKQREGTDTRFPQQVRRMKIPFPRWPRHDTALKLPGPVQFLYKLGSDRYDIRLRPNHVMGRKNRPPDVPEIIWAELNWDRYRRWRLSRDIQRFLSQKRSNELTRLGTPAAQRT